MADPSYGERLKAAMLRQPGSRRRLSFQLAELTGNKQPSEYRALGKYLSGDELPSVDRAALLARLTGEAGLAVVPTNGDRRRGRQAELEERVADLERAMDQLGPDLAALGRLSERVLLLEQQAQPKRRGAGKKAAG